jgi:dephospho-CoA kinase
MGAATIDADKVGHLALEDPMVKELVAKRFGDAILSSDGSIDRRRLGAEAFQDAAKRRDLEAITHPWIRAHIRSTLDRLLSECEVPAIVLDVSLLLESGAYDSDVGLFVFVDTPEEVRRSRAALNRSWGENEVARRESHQLDLKHKRRRADAVLENRGSPESLKQQVKDLWQRHISN